MNSEAHETGPARRRTGVPRDMPDQEAKPGEETEEDTGGGGLPDTDEAGSGPRGTGASGDGEGSGDREPPEPVESTD